MNLKEFDYKQFLLEKGERVGLGVALTLMVLMLVLSLFMPSSGFFSGSPSAKAKPLEEGSKSLQNALATRTPTEKDLPPPNPESRLIDLDTERLKEEPYETKSWFTPSHSESPTRRPPEILAAKEAAMEAARLPINTYLFTQNFTRVTVLQDKDRRGTGTGPAMGRSGPMSGMSAMMQRMGGRSGGMMGGGGMSGGRGGPPPGMGMMGMMFGRSGGNVQGADEKPEYEAREVKVTDVGDNAHLARQVRPAHMVIVAASFPYKAQLEEFKNKLHHSDIQAVLNETVEYETKEGKEQLAAFRFVGVEVQRQELDASGKVVKDWEDPKLADAYKYWLLYTGMEFEKEHSKYEPLEPLFPGLVMPRLKVFREESQQETTAMSGPGVPPGVGIGAAQPPLTKGKEAGSKDNVMDTEYPDVAGKLETIKETLDKLSAAGPKPIALPPEKFRGVQEFNAFNASSPNTGSEKKDTTANIPGDKLKEAAQDLTIPDYTLIRFVDTTVEPGKTYRYRFKVKMANPNYHRDDVASPAYKSDLEITAKNWFEVPGKVHVPPDMTYYVVDQKDLTKNERPPRGTPQDKLWQAPLSPDSQVAFQFQRWVTETPVNKEPVPIGEWAVADRVPVARGEYIGRVVKVDLPIWKYTQDSYVLPAEDQQKRSRGRAAPTGIYVSFAYENQDGNEAILVDFEGGKAQSEGKLNDSSEVEVLMLSPDGKLLARNSADDSSDPERIERRKTYLDRVQHVRQGTSPSRAPTLPRGGRGGIP